VIEVEGLVKSYGRGSVRALDDVSFTVPKADIFGFLGPNGAGKTTTIRILSTVLDPTAGTIRIDGHDLSAEPLAVKERLGLMPDEVAFYPTLTGEQHLLYYASFHGIPRAEARKRAKEALERFGIADAASKKLKAYSHGMKKRLALAQCLLHDPEVIIMDEPANGLDPQGMRYFRDLIRALNREGKTIFLSSHLLSEVEHLCERVGIIDRGHMVAVDSIANLMARLAAGTPTILHVVATDVSDAALAALQEVPGVTSVARTPGGVDVTAEARSDVSADVSKTLVLAGARLRELRSEQRSLEDLFLALTKGGAP
jgi:ABC-2 type transport system ATP-binding protein